MLTDTGGNRMTGASVALRVLAEARQDGLDDKEILVRSPAVLALTGPQVARSPVLPEEAMTLHIPTAPACQRCSNNGILREALRLRVRWVQELSGRAAWELGERLAAAGDLTEPELIRHMTLEHVEAVATKRAVVIPALVAGHHHDFGAPLPAWFQLSDLGKPIRIAVRQRGGRRHRRRRRFGQRAGQLRHRRSAHRLGPRHHDAVTRARAAAPAAEGHRVRDRLGAVPPRHPGP